MNVCEECGLPVNLCIAVSHCRLSFAMMQAGELLLSREHAMSSMLALGAYCDEADQIVDLGSSQHSAAVH